MQLALIILGLPVTKEFRLLHILMADIFRVPYQIVVHAIALIKLICLLKICKGTWLCQPLVDKCSNWSSNNTGIACCWVSAIHDECLLHQYQYNNQQLYIWWAFSVSHSQWNKAHLSCRGPSLNGNESSSAPWIFVGINIQWKWQSYHNKLLHLA